VLLHIVFLDKGFRFWRQVVQILKKHNPFILIVPHVSVPATSVADTDPHGSVSFSMIRDPFPGV
jgi:hypothetical protein